MRSLTTDFQQAHLRPYFLWDEDVSIDEFRERLKNGAPDDRTRLLAKLLREARDTDVWLFVSPREVADSLPSVRARLGRRRRFWEFLIDGWRQDALLPR